MAQRKQQRMEGSGCGRCPVGWRSVPGKEMGSGCKGEMIQQRPLLVGGGSSGGNKTIQKVAKTGGAGD